MTTGGWRISIIRAGRVAGEVRGFGIGWWEGLSQVEVRRGWLVDMRWI
jgi:hypothetical protein